MLLPRQSGGIVATKVTDTLVTFPCMAMSLVVWYLVSVRWYEGPSPMQNSECK